MMRIALLLLIVGTVFLGAGCCNPPSGSREFIPGEGWKPTD